MRSPFISGLSLVPLGTPPVLAEGEALEHQQGLQDRVERVGNLILPWEGWNPGGDSPADFTCLATFDVDVMFVCSSHLPTPGGGGGPEENSQEAGINPTVAEIRTKEKEPPFSQLKSGSQSPSGGHVSSSNPRTKENKLPSSS